MSFLVCRAGILLCIKQSLLLKYCFLIICPPREFFVLFVIKVMALVVGRERNTVVSWHSNFYPLFVRGKLPLNRHTSINLLLQFNVDALKKLAQHIWEKKIENPLKRYQERMRWRYKSSFQAPLFFGKSSDRINTSRIFLKTFLRIRNYVKVMKPNKANKKVYSSIKWFKRVRANVPGPWPRNVNSCPFTYHIIYASEELM